MDERTTTTSVSGHTAHLDPLPAAPFSAMTDVELVGWAQRDEAAFAELFSRHVGNVRRRALQRTGSPEVAELIVMATASRARRTIGSATAARDVRRWVLDATENECIGWFERGRPVAAAEGAADPVDVEATSVPASAPGRRSALARIGSRALAGVRAAAQPDRLI